MKVKCPSSKAFLFSDPKVHSQFRQRWSKGSELASWYVFYKVGICIFYWANIAYTWYKHHQNHEGTPSAWKYLIWLTNWDACLLGAALFLDTLIVLLLAGRRNVSERLLYCSWFFSTAIYSLALMVTALFWTLLYKYDEAPSYANLFVHLLQSVVVLVDQCVSRRKWEPLTAWASIPVPLVWLIFSLVYWAVGGTNYDGDNYIYSVLKWGESPGQAVGVTFLAVAALPLIHCLLAVITRARDRCHQKIWRVNNEDNIV